MKVSPAHTVLLKRIQEFYAAHEGTMPDDSATLEAAIEALAIKTLGDHPKGSAYRIRHKDAVQVEEARVGMQAIYDLVRQNRKRKVIYFA